MKRFYVVPPIPVPGPQVGGPEEVACLERAEVVRGGADISIFTYSRMRYVVMQAVAELEKQGYNPEVGVLCDCGCMCVVSGARVM